MLRSLFKSHYCKHIKTPVPLAAGLKQDFLEKMDEIGLKKYDFELKDGTSVTAFEAGMDQLGPAAQNVNLVVPTTIGYNVPTPEEQAELAEQVH